jgi:hypothetical protein
LIIPTIRTGKPKSLNKWMIEIGEYSGRITRYTLEEAKHPILLDSGQRLKGLAKSYFKI